MATSSSGYTSLMQMPAPNQAYSREKAYGSSANSNKQNPPLFHRPSPYMRRMQLPRLEFSNHYAPYDFDDDSPDELCARVEFIQLKNAQISRERADEIAPIQEASSAAVEQKMEKQQQKRIQLRSQEVPNRDEDRVKKNATKKTEKKMDLDSSCSKKKTISADPTKSAKKHAKEMPVKLSNKK